jgi:hypothetical protein
MNNYLINSNLFTERIGNDHKNCPNCDSGPIENKDVNKFLRGYYKGSAGQSYRNY